MIINTEQLMTYVYLISAPHSGSTLLSMVLGGHNKISTVGELGGYLADDMKCSCGKLFSECEFWIDYKNNANTRGVTFKNGQFDINVSPPMDASFVQKIYYHQFSNKMIDLLKEKALYHFVDSEKITRKVNKNIQLADILCKKDCTSLFLDTTKNLYQMQPLYQNFKENLKIIVLVRDGRAVVNSLLRKEQRLYPTTEKAAMVYLWIYKQIEYFLHNYMDQNDFIWVKYEDFCLNTEQTLEAIFKFLQVPFHSTTDLNFSKLHIIGNGMRLHFNGDIHKPNETWRWQLSKEQIQSFQEIAGKINAKYGYSNS